MCTDVSELGKKNKQEKTPLPTKSTPPKKNPKPKKKKPQTTCEEMLHYFQNEKMMLVQIEKWVRLDLEEQKPPALSCSPLKAWSPQLQFL